MTRYLHREGDEQQGVFRVDRLRCVLTLNQNVLILLASVATSLSFMVALNRVWPVPRRYASSDQIGWQLSVLGTTYAVLLGFMLSTQWQNFVAAELNADLEASALRNLFRLAEGLPPAQRAMLEAQTRAYVTAVLDDDWPAMARGEIPEKSHHFNESMWHTLLAVRATSAAESSAADHAMSELSVMTTHRRTRLLQSETRFPTIFWFVLLAGGVLTILSVSMFGSIYPKVHALQVFSLTLLVTLVMLAIADINSPYRGWVHISDYPFRRAQTNLLEAE
jgi:hypothetical protein